MKKAILVFLAVLTFVSSAAAQSSIYVFPNDGFRFQQKEGETVLTRTNLETNSELISQLGTTVEAVRASYDATGIVMEVITAEGRQIAFSVSPADLKDTADEMADLKETGKNALLQRFSESGLYQDCGFAEGLPDWIRMMSSAMYGSMPVWQLRYTTLHLGRFLTVNSTAVGREPTAEDDELLVDLISRMKLLAPLPQQDSPSPEVTATPSPQPVQNENAAKLIITEPEDMTFTGSRVLVRGLTEPNATVFAASDSMHTSVKANKNGAFSVPITLEKAGSEVFRLRVNPKDKEETIVEITLTRVLTEREQLAAFKATQTQARYEDLLADPSAYIGKNFIFRGKVMGFTDLDGQPCALVCVSNPQTGIWRDPIYAVLKVDDEVNIGDVLTFYLVVTGITLPAPGEYLESGMETEVPVASVFHYTANR